MKDHRKTLRPHSDLDVMSETNGKLTKKWNLMRVFTLFYNMGPNEGLNYCSFNSHSYPSSIKPIVYVWKHLLNERTNSCHSSFNSSSCLNTSGLVVTFPQRTNYSWVKTWVQFARHVHFWIMNSEITNYKRKQYFKLYYFSFFKKGDV